MMTLTWQDAATAGILVGAVGYLARRVVRLIRGRGLPACGGTNCCAQCVSKPAQEPLVTINPPTGK
jgi:hypothetical protein